MGGHDSISAVLPTFNRADALKENLDTLLAVRGVEEVIVVVDGSSDRTDEVLAGFDDEHLRVVRHPTNRGVSAARNTGIREARGAWVLFGEDDCRFPADYAVVLQEEAARHGADIIGAPLLHLAGDDDDAHRTAAEAPRVERRSPEQVGVFVNRAAETPFIPATALIKRSVFNTLHFDEGYGGNAYREETDFFVQAVRAGYRCWFTPATYSWQLDTWRGGNHENRGLRYEYWALRNNWRFLSRHGSWLSAHDYIDSPSIAWLGFAGRRLRDFVRGALRARLVSLRRARA
jgi:glycosyltransferase involved in cell wall biosynthesis